MLSLSDLLSPSSIIVGIIFAILVMLFQYFRQAIDALKDATNKEFQTVNADLIRLKLEIGYREELNEVRKSNDELRRELTELRNERRI